MGGYKSKWQDKMQNSCQKKANKWHLECQMAETWQKHGRTIAEQWQNNFRNGRCKNAIAESQTWQTTGRKWRTEQWQQTAPTNPKGRKKGSHNSTWQKVAAEKWHANLGPRKEKA